MFYLNNVTKKYCDDKNDSVIALDNINLKLPENGLVIINGTSGCGKTTLLNVLGGLDNPTSGELYLNNERIDNKSEAWWDAFRGSYLGFIYQDFNLLDNMTVRENILLPLSFCDINDEEKNKRINEIVNELGINEYLDKKTSKLSGGQKQRVAIARALVSGTKIILADEPTGNLDEENSENVFRILKEIAKTHLVVVVTHDSVLAEKYADRLVRISYGKIENDIEKELDNANEDAPVAAIENIEIKKTKMPLKECFKFAKEAIAQRKTRAFVSVMIFSITLIFALLLCSFLFRSDSSSTEKYLTDSNYKIVPLCMNVPDKYADFSNDGKIFYGRKVYELMCEDTDVGRIVEYGSAEVISGNYENYFQSVIYINDNNEKYITYEGKYPSKDNEIAISKAFADELKIKGNIINSKLVVDGKECIVTAVVSHVCDEEFENFAIYDGYEKENIGKAIFVKKDVKQQDKAESIYISGFGVTEYSNLFYQTTVYNDICPVDGANELLEGRMPEKDSEILISSYQYEFAKELGREMIGTTHRIEDLYKKEHGCTFWDRLNLYDYIGETFTIVGVVSGEGDYYVTNGVYDKISLEYEKYYNTSYLLLINQDEIEDDIDRLFEDGIRVYDPKLQTAYDFTKEMESITFAMIVVAVIVALLSVLQMISLYTYSINDNKKTIGILRTIGVNKADTKKIFTQECLLISVISLLIAIALSLILTKAINEFISANVYNFSGFEFLDFSIGTIFIVGCINCVLSILSVVIPLRKYSKCKIIELIK